MTTHMVNHDKKYMSVWHTRHTKSTFTFNETPRKFFDVWRWCRGGHLFLRQYIIRHTYTLLYRVIFINLPTRNFSKKN
jgi:hypothetical protein